MKNVKLVAIQNCRNRTDSYKKSQQQCIAADF